ncbi:hypothetical protein [Helicobacter felistomachi]|uniref:hypothetical protein n=1 Tax=Helicobacter felistomachi TaxID=3040201 RepID=UPI002573E4CA|nr:hypothetical protein [Helicobacter sp. NHP21005]
MIRDNPSGAPLAANHDQKLLQFLLETSSFKEEYRTDSLRKSVIALSLSKTSSWNF